MKKHVLTAVVVIGFVLGAWRLGQAQGQVVQFHFTIQRTDAGVTMACSQGCAWKTLSFGLSGDRAQAVDGMGMAEK
jgi:hypothetical protein